MIPIHDPAFVDAERRRQRREFEEIAEAAVVELNPDADAPTGRFCADAEAVEEPPPPPRVPRTPSEAAAMRRERERAAGLDGARAQGARAFHALPATFPKRRG